MRRRASGRALLAVASGLAAAGFVASCGSRTGLDDGSFTIVGPGEVAPDSSGDDAPDDSSLPPIETGPLADVALTNCSDPSVEYIYLVTRENDLWSFFPPSATFTPIGALRCPAQAGASPFSMAVDRQGTAYVIYDSGELFRVSTKTAQCQATPFVALNPNFETFGMGFVGNANGATDTLFIASANQGTSTLATVDLQTFQTSVVGPLALQAAELTGTGDGRLFSFYSTDSTSSATAIAQVDPTTAMVVANSNLTDLPQGTGWAFGFWGGDFYLFTAPLGSSSMSTVTRFSPNDGSQTTVATLSEEIVGAGVSTCAPQM
jgi:hypothetical protein